MAAMYFSLRLIPLQRHVALAVADEGRFVPPPLGVDAGIGDCNHCVLRTNRYETMTPMIDVDGTDMRTSDAWPGVRAVVSALGIGKLACFERSTPPGETIAKDDQRWRVLPSPSGDGLPAFRPGSGC